MSQMTPREIVEELDKHIVGQKAAKRAVAIALRNRIVRNWSWGFGKIRNQADGSHKAISLSYHRFQKTWLVCVVAQRAANLAYDIVDIAFGIDKEI